MSGIATIGDVVREWRSYRQISLTDFSQQTKLSKGYISELEHNKIDNPKQDKLETLATALGISVRDIVSRRLPAETEGEDDNKVGQVVTQDSPAQQLPSVPGIEWADVRQILAQLQGLPAAVSQLTAVVGQLAAQLAALQQLITATHTPADVSQSDAEEEDEPALSLDAQLPLDTQIALGTSEAVGRVHVESTLQPFLRKVINALGVLPLLDKPHSGSITFTFQAEVDAFRHDTELKALWVDSLSEAMNKGWDILHLVRLTEATERTCIVVDHIRRYLGHLGDYQVYYTKYTPARPLQEFLVVDAPSRVSQARMAIEFSSKTEQYIDDGRIFRYSEQADIDRILGVLRQWKGEERFGYNRLFDIYQKWRKDDLDTAGKWDKIVTDVEKEDGSLSLFMNGLPGNTVPHEQYIAQLAPLLKVGEVAGLLHDAIAHRQERIDEFERQVKNHLFRHIMPIGALQWYKLTGYPSPDAWAFLYEGEPATRDQRMTHLNAIFDRLKNDNYQIGLMRGYFEDEAKIYKQVFWQVKEGHAVLLENLFSGEETDVKITEPWVVKAFGRKFDDILQHPLVATDRSEVQDLLLALV